MSKQEKDSLKWKKHKVILPKNYIMDKTSSNPLCSRSLGSNFLPMFPRGMLYSHKNAPRETGLPMWDGVCELVCCALQLFEGLDHLVEIVSERLFYQKLASSFFCTPPFWCVHLLGLLRCCPKRIPSRSCCDHADKTSLWAIDPCFPPGWLLPFQMLARTGTCWWSFGG